MTRSIRGTRRATVLVAGVAATTLLMSGCGTGQIAETANKKSSVPGVNVDSPDGSVAIRNLMVAYNDPQGYPAGGDAPIAATILNQSRAPVTVRITTGAPVDGTETNAVAWGSAVLLTRGDTAARPAPPATPTDAATPSVAETASPTPPAASPSTPAPADFPAVIEIPASGSVSYATTGGQLLKVVGLDKPLTPGKSVNLTFSFSNSDQQLTIAAPVGMPLSPAPRGTPQHEGGGEGESH